MKVVRAFSKDLEELERAPSQAGFMDLPAGSLGHRFGGRFGLPRHVGGSYQRVAVCRAEVWLSIDDDFRMHRTGSGYGRRLQPVSVLDDTEDARDWNPHGARGRRRGRSRNGSQDRVATRCGGLGDRDSSQSRAGANNRDSVGGRDGIRSADACSDDVVADDYGSNRVLDSSAKGGACRSNGRAPLRITDGAFGGVGGQKHMSRVTRLAGSTLEAFAILLAWASFGQATSNAQIFALSDTKDLVLSNVKADAIEYKGRKAVRLTKDTEKDGFALLRGTEFQDGTIEGDIALKITTPPGVRMPGFVGIAFRARPDASRYELFYLRPGNSRSDDQAMRNHSVQYTSEPDFGWYKLRREWPAIYETYADLQPEKWTKVRIEVMGRSAKLFLNGSENPTLVVDGLKGQDLRGGVGLWSYQGEEAYFSNVSITNSTPLPVKNGSDASGTWQVRFSSDAGIFDSILQLKRDAGKVTGTASGTLGNARPVTGTWRDGYVELSFNADWPSGGGGAGTAAVATLAGWIDGDSAGGRMKVEGRADGRWTATRKP